jgi:hypothetical protein
MTRDEFAKWGRHHQAIFPDFSAWWEKLKADNRESAEVLSRQWFEILEKVNLPDAIAASNRMLDGTVELCPAYERSMLAARIAAAAREIAADRSPRREEYVPKYRPRQPGEGPTAGEIYSQCRERVKNGEDPIAVARELVGSVERGDGRRYSCVKCLDTGLVWVWHNVSVQAAMHGEIPSRKDRRVMSVACDCFRGAAFCIADDVVKRKDWQGWRESARYSPDRYCRCTNANVDDPDRISELVEWVQDYAAKRVRNAPNYSPVLSAWSGAAS